MVLGISHHGILKTSHSEVLDVMDGHNCIITTHKLSVPHNSLALSDASHSLSSTRRAAQCSERSAWSSRSRSRCRSGMDLVLRFQYTQSKGFHTSFFLMSIPLPQSFRYFRMSLEVWETTIILNYPYLASDEILIMWRRGPLHILHPVRLTVVRAIDHADEMRSLGREDLKGKRIVVWLPYRQNDSSMKKSFESSHY